MKISRLSALIMCLLGSASLVNEIVSAPAAEPIAASDKNQPTNKAASNESIVVGKSEIVSSLSMQPVTAPEAGQLPNNSTPNGLIIVRNGDTISKLARRYYKNITGKKPTEQQVVALVNYVHKSGLIAPGFIFPGSVVDFGDAIDKLDFQQPVKLEWLGKSLPNSPMDILLKNEQYEIIVSGTVDRVIKKVFNNHKVTRETLMLDDEKINIWFQLYTRRTNYSKQFLDHLDKEGWERYVEERIKAPEQRGLAIIPSTSLSNLAGTAGNESALVGANKNKSISSGDNPIDGDSNKSTTGEPSAVEAPSTDTSVADKSAIDGNGATETADASSNTTPISEVASGGSAGSEIAGGSGAANAASAAASGAAAIAAAGTAISSNPISAIAPGASAAVIGASAAIASTVASNIVSAVALPVMIDFADDEGGEQTANAAITEKGEVISHHGTMDEDYYILSDRRKNEIIFAMADSGEYCIPTDSIGLFPINQEAVKNLPTVTAMEMPCYELTSLGFFDIDLSNLSFSFLPLPSLSKTEQLAEELAKGPEALLLADQDAIWLNYDINFNHYDDKTEFSALNADLNWGTKYGIFGARGSYRDDELFGLESISHRYEFDNGYDIQTSASLLNSTRIQTTLSGNNNLMDRPTYDFSMLEAVEAHGPGIVRIYENDLLIREDRFTQSRLNLSSYRSQLTPSRRIVIIDRYNDKKELTFNDMPEQLYEDLSWTVSTDYTEDDDAFGGRAYLQYRYNRFSTSGSFSYDGDNFNSYASIGYGGNNWSGSTSYRYNNGLESGSTYLSYNLLGVSLYGNRTYGELESTDYVYEYGASYRFSSLWGQPNISYVRSLRNDDLMRDRVILSSRINRYLSLNLRAEKDDNETYTSLSFNFSKDTRHDNLSSRLQLTTDTYRRNESEPYETNVSTDMTLWHRYARLDADVNYNGKSESTNAYVKLGSALAYSDGDFGVSRPITQSLGVIRLPKLEEPIKVHTNKLTFETDSTAFFPIYSGSKVKASLHSADLQSLDGTKLSFATSEGYADVQDVQVLSDGLMLSTGKIEGCNESGLSLDINGRKYPYFTDMGFFIDQLMTGKYDYTINHEGKMIKEGQINLDLGFKEEQLTGLSCR